MKTTRFSERQTCLLQCTDRRHQTYQLLWGEREVTDEMGTQYEYDYEVFPFCPPMSLVKDTVLEGMNERIDESIMSGYSYEGIPVWLSTENQMNYKSAYDFAVLDGGSSLPYTFKLGTTEHPVYHTFSTLDELREFCTGAKNHVLMELAKGWAAKDSVNWSRYDTSGKVNNGVQEAAGGAK